MKYQYLPLVVLYSLIALAGTHQLQAQDVIINEFMASNTDSVEDEDGDAEDWIEIQNRGGVTVNLAGWFLTDKSDNLTKWQFPSVTLAPNAFLLVFASEKDRIVGELHANFRLGADGEYLALVDPQTNVVSEFSPAYPIQAPDVSYGIRGTSSLETILAQGAPAKALIPTNASLEPAVPAPDVIRPWTDEALDDSAWLSGTTGVGYDYAGLVGLDVAAMQNNNETVYIRVPFNVTDPSTFQSLTLRMRYDDGFIAYINGREVAADNAPDPLLATYNSGAPANRPDSTAVQPLDFNISAFIDFLHPGVNVLAIHGLNNLAASSDLLALPELLATVSGMGASSVRYFPVPTPGEPNNAGVAVLGPIIEDETHRPENPLPTDSIEVSARVRPAFGTITGVNLRYRVMFGPEVALPMLDDGNSGDEAIGDGIYGARIPASALNAGEMIRWYITAADSAANSSRSPTFADPSNSPEYFGTAVADLGLNNPLPVFHWFIQSPGSADNDTGTRCSLYYDGEFYDNLLINIHGQSSRGFPKKSYDIDFHPGHNFKWKAGEPRADDINFMTTYPDKAHMRNVLAYETYRESDNAHHWVIPVRVEQNGSFWGTAHLMENGDEDWLIRMGINPEGALYKMYSTFASASGFEKKTRKSEGTADLSAFNAGVSLTGEARRQYMYDNVNVAQVVNFLAGMAITADTDCCHKNYYFYRDTGLTDEWQMWPWDVDLSFGRRWIGAQTYWDDDMIVDTALQVGSNNKVPQAIFGITEIRQMYYRRIRTMMDEMMKPPGTPPEGLVYEKRIAELAAMLEPDATLDAARWNSHAWGNGSTAACCPQTFAQAVADITDVWLPQRRLQLYNRLAGSSSEIPDAQPPGTVIQFGTIEPSPAGNNQDQEYIQLTNPNGFAVDISAWTLSGAVQLVIGGGTVIPAGGTLYVSPNRKVWRTRTTNPRGGQALHVIGDYEGHLSARGEPILLTDRQGIIVASVNTPPVPSLVQSFLRISEIMYHPPALPMDAFDSEEYEYIELVNNSAGTLNLTGVHFTNGISFNFTGSAIPSLAAGARALVVRNTAAFTERYGPGLPIAGEYTGNLANAGETIELNDIRSEKILDFNYNNNWYRITDGRGFSLVIVDQTAPFNTWDLKESWRPSGIEYGSPGAGDSPQPAIPAILINEVLTHTDPPDLDTIELFNPTAGPVDIGGWYLTDDPSFPKKYRIPGGTSIAAGGYVSFDESEFDSDPGVPPSFALSSTGDETYLYSANAAGELTGYHQGQSFGAARNGVSIGRHIDSQGVEHFVAMDSFTPNAANSGPEAGPVIISEVMYHPLPIQEGVDLVENSRDEFIEIQNISGAPVPLHDPSNPDNTWQIQGGAGFVFPPGISLPADGQALIVSFDPVNNPAARAAFEAAYGLPGGIQIFGPFSGQLNNAGDSLRLHRPDSPNGPTVPYVLVERIDYTDDIPWPLAADGTGPSLQRVNATGFGNDPANWTAAAPTPAAPFGGGNPPVVTTHPQSRSVVAFSSVTMSVVVTGDPPFSYQWRKDGQNIPGAVNSSLNIPSVQAADQGSYQVLVLNASGSAASSNATLTVLIPAVITQQPQDTSANAGGSVILVLSATSSSPITYQWRKNGADIPGATSAFLSLPNLQVSDGATYDAAVTDAVGTILSDPAVLTILLHPTITSHPEDRTVTTGATPINISLSVTASSATPLSFQWLFNGSPLATGPRIPTVTTATLDINAVELFDTGDYSVVVSDSYGAVTSQVARLQVNTRAVVTQAPLSQQAPEGGMVSFSAAWTGSGPFLHRWRDTSRGNANIGILAPSTFEVLYITSGYITASPTNSVLVFTNITTALNGTYDVVISNAVGQLATTDGTLTVILDTDHDGLPNTWEDTNGFNPNDPADGLRDDDNDTVSNADEYFSGTDHTDPDSFLKVQINQDGTARLTFQAVAGRTYTVQRTAGIHPATWTTLQIEPAGNTTRTVTLTDPVPGNNRTYRLVTPAVP